LATPEIHHVEPVGTDEEHLDDELWAKACTLSNIHAIEQYLRTDTPFKKRHVREAEQLFENLEKQDRSKDDLLWKQACKDNTFEAYQRYLVADLYSRRHADEGRKKLEVLTQKTEVAEQTRNDEIPVPPLRPQWVKFAVIGFVTLLAYVLWAYMGGNGKSPADADQQAQISDLLRLASVDIVADRLSSPSGNNALEKYQQVLALQPGHTEAQQGIKNVAARYLELYQRALSRGDVGNAKGYLERAASLDADIAAHRDRYDSEMTAKLQPLAISPPADTQPPLVLNQSITEQDKNRCKDLIAAGWRSLGGQAESDFEEALSLVQQAKSILPDCPGADDLLKKALSQRDFFVTKRLQKEREDSVNRDRCQAQVNQGRQALQARRYDQALKYAASARSAFAQCPGVDSLEQEANAALSTESQLADTENRSKCESIVNAGNDAFLRRDYRAALRNAAQAKRVYPNCADADDLLNRTNEAVCTSYVVDGKEAMRAGRYSQALSSARRAINTFARCPGAEPLEQEALMAMAMSKDKFEQERQEKAKVRCEALMDAARTALLDKNYTTAIKQAQSARRAYSQCPGAESFEIDAMEAKRKAMEITTIN